jgi:hypothetical protein
MNSIEGGSDPFRFEGINATYATGSSQSFFISAKFYTFAGVMCIGMKTDFVKP